MSKGKILNIRVIPRSGRNEVKQEGASLRVYLTRAPEKGLANKQLIELLADYLGVKKYQVRIIRGESSRNKAVEVLGPSLKVSGRPIPFGLDA